MTSMMTQRKASYSWSGKKNELYESTLARVEPIAKGEIERVKRVNYNMSVEGYFFF